MLWLLLGLCTCGVAFFVFPYSFGETVINSTRLVDEHGRVLGRLRCTQGVAGHVGHAIVWWLFAFLTCGVAGLFYMYRVGTDLLSSTVIDPVRA